MNSTNTSSLQATSAAENASNMTNGAFAFDVSLSLRVGMTIAYTVTFIVGFFGNAIGMYVVCKRTGVLSVTNLLIANMAFADLVVTLFAMPTSVAQLYIENRWIGGLFGAFLCKIAHFSFFVSLAASVFTIVFISVERFIAIFFPLRGDSLKSPKRMTCSIWALSFCCTMPFLILFTTQEHPDGNSYCIVQWPWPGDYASTRRVLREYFVAIFVILYCFPVLFLGLLYSLISCKLWVRTIPGNSTKNNRTALHKSRKKVVKLLIGVVAVFTVCWFPAHVMHYLIVFRPDIYDRIYHVAFFVFWLCQANSSINPCLYILLNESFRQDFGKAFVDFISKVKKVFSPRTSSCLRRARPRARNRSSSSTINPGQQRRLSFMQLIQAVRGTFSSAFSPAPSTRITVDTKLPRNSLTPMQHVRVAGDTKF